MKKVFEIIIGNKNNKLIKMNGLLRYENYVVDLKNSTNDLKNNTFPLGLLALYSKYIDYRVILRTQKHLTAEFCAKYIMDPKRLTVEEAYVMDIEYIRGYQPHLTEDDLRDACEALGIYEY